MSLFLWFKVFNLEPPQVSPPFLCDMSRIIEFLCRSVNNLVATQVKEDQTANRKLDRVKVRPSILGILEQLEVDVDCPFCKSNISRWVETVFVGPLSHFERGYRARCRGDVFCTPVLMG